MDSYTRVFDHSLNAMVVERYREKSFYKNGIIKKYTEYLIDNIDSFKDFKPFFSDKHFDIEGLLPILLPRISNHMMGIIFTDNLDFSRILQKYNLSDFSFKSENIDKPVATDELKIILETSLCAPFKNNDYEEIRLSDNLTFDMFKNIPDQAISAFLNYPVIKEWRTGIYGFDEKDYIIEKIVENTHSLGVGRIRYGNLGFYFKAYDNLESTIRETLSAFHKFGTDIMYNNSAFHCMINDKGYLKVGDYYFIMTSEQNNETSNSKIKRNRHYYEMERVFEIIEEKYEKLHAFDRFNARMYVVSAFHSEMKDMFIPKEYEHFFHRETIKNFDSLMENLSNEDYKLVKPLRQTYSEIKKRHDDMEKSRIAHTNTKFDNWSKTDSLLDYGTVCFENPYCDFEVSLFNSNFENREKYRKSGFLIDKTLHELLGIENNMPNIDLFNKYCLERGFTDSLKYMNWSLKKDDGNFDFYKNNLLFYEAMIKR